MMYGRTTGPLRTLDVDQSKKKYSWRWKASEPEITLVIVSWSA